VTTLAAGTSANPLVSAICHQRIAPDQHQRYNSGLTVLGYWSMHGNELPTISSVIHEPWRLSPAGLRSGMAERLTTAGKRPLIETIETWHLRAVTKVTVGQYVKLQVWTNRAHDASLAEFG
jgi:hypothetical protein